MSSKARPGLAPVGDAPLRVHPLPRARNKSSRGVKVSLLSMAESVGNMGHWHWQIEGGLVSWSEQVYHICGRDPASFTPDFEAITQVYHPDDRAKAAQYNQTAALSGIPFEYDARIVRPDGEIRRVIVRGEPECVDGKPSALFGVITDVTEAFATINAIEEQHELLDLAAEVAQLGHWVWAVDRSIISFCSDHLARIHGTSVSALLARFTHPAQFSIGLVASHRERYRTTVAAALDEGKPYAIEYRLVTPDGTPKEIREIGHPLFDSNGILTRFIGTVQDVSDVKRRENELRRAKATLEVQAEALRRSETKFRDIVEGSIQGILVLRDFKPVFANEAYARMLGLSGPEEVIALGDLRRVMMTDGVDNDAYWRMAMEGRLDGTTHRAALRMIDGRIVWIDAIGRMIEWEGDPSFLLTVIDVTERHLAEQEILKKSHQLQELNIQKDKLFSIIAHDLKGPFNGVIGFSDFLASRAEHLSPAEVADYARLVRDSAISVHGLFDNLLAWAAFQIRDAAPRFAPVDLLEAVDSSIEPLRAMAAEKGVSVINGIGGTAQDIHVLADEELLRVVLRNLVSNGIKFSHPGGAVNVTATAASMVRICVEDKGIGMKSTEVATLFHLDRNTSAPGTRGEKGTGLGLYLCHDIVTRHGGTITAESSPGQGSTFHVSLPRAYPQHDL